jgi:ABC-type ATPase with predicted acetyltransferase domain
MMENLRQAWARELGGEQKKLTELAELFEQLDRVKFTDHVPASIESQGIVHIAREFVRATRRRPMPVETSNGGGVNAVR